MHQKNQIYGYTEYCKHTRSSCHFIYLFSFLKPSSSASRVIYIFLYRGVFAEGNGTKRDGELVCHCKRLSALYWRKRVTADLTLFAFRVLLSAVPSTHHSLFPLLRYHSICFISFRSPFRLTSKEKDCVRSVKGLVRLDSV